MTRDPVFDRIEYDCGYVHPTLRKPGGRVTCRQREDGWWNVLWVSFRPGAEPVVIGSRPTLDEARKFGWAYHAREEAERGRR